MGEKSVKCEESEASTSRQKKRRVIIEDEEESEVAVESQADDVSEKSSQESHENDFEVEQIIDKRIERDGTPSYKVKWRNYSPRWNEWVREKDCACPLLIEEFEKNITSKRPTQKRECHQKSPSPGTSTLRSTRLSSHSTEKSPRKLLANAVDKTPIKEDNNKHTRTHNAPGKEFCSSPKRKLGGASPNRKKIAEKAPPIMRKKEVIPRNEMVGHGTSITKAKETDLPSTSTNNDKLIEQQKTLDEVSQNNTSETVPAHSIGTALSFKTRDERSTIHNANDGKAGPIWPVRKSRPTLTPEGLFVLTSERVVSTAGRPPKERELLLARQNKKAQLAQERGIVTVHPTPSEQTSTTPQKTRSPPQSKKKRVPPPLPKKPSILNEHLLLKEKEAEEKTQATYGSSITSPNDSETLSDEDPKQHLNSKTVTKPATRVSDERLTSISVSLSRPELNSTISKTFKEPVRERNSLNIKEVPGTSMIRNELEDDLRTNRGNDFERPSNIKREVEMSEAEMAEEQWKREQEKRRREQLAERQKEAEKREKRLEKRKPKETREKERIYDPRAVSPVRAEIYDPRAVPNYQQRMKARNEANGENSSVPGCSRNEERDRPCLLDRGIKIEKIETLFYVDGELMGLCKYMNCLEMQIVSVEKLKKLDPVALIHAWEEIFWDNQPTDDDA